ncbi:hypothetical protein PXK30_03780 [Phaeobacter gallaeciensis]|uniref:hypothetical protein n=1 Tax=Phaeobacter gallaeciensis TaxID=60890 RepID=UPI00237F4433|nr:hypothetical protein [Phaeobacter gallaeciensis]MDE4304028.1 hypothetical protein [Phaeobacter gallaeciensis]MDE4309088.1 hypothetical protein [Phaeobacter gallaeciensis]MDE4313358.1 hypothetical protein [Phaeobacter gallaeciensis]MDE4318017.1 hypothetical protein [Phaeobacter gallaeciensis]MDE4322480.1 hypothetical protein [Phaeobacter gallaeciensis]
MVGPVKSLFGVAGPQASLKDAGGGGAAGMSNYVVNYQTLNGADDLPKVMDISSWDIQPGDLLVTIIFTGAWFDTNHGPTVISSSGWTLWHTDPGFGRIYYKEADGTETEVTANGLENNGGVFSVYHLRGVEMPGAKTATNTVCEFINDTGNDTTFPAFPGAYGTDYDLLLFWVFSYNETYTAVSIPFSGLNTHFHMVDANGRYPTSLLLSGAGASSGGIFADSIDTSGGMYMYLYRVGLFIK